MFSEKKISYVSPCLQTIDVEVEDVIAVSLWPDPEPDMKPLPPNPIIVEQRVYQNAYPTEFEL